jgi:hypothetical protein
MASHPGSGGIEDNGGPVERACIARVVAEIDQNRGRL